jgi:hypothetical protein
LIFVVFSVGVFINFLLFVFSYHVGDYRMFNSMFQTKSTQESHLPRSLEKEEDEKKNDTIAENSWLVFADAHTPSTAVTNNLRVWIGLDISGSQNRNPGLILQMLREINYDLISPFGPMKNTCRKLIKCVTKAADAGTLEGLRSPVDDGREVLIAESSFLARRLYGVVDPSTHRVMTQEAQRVSSIPAYTCTQYTYSKADFTKIGDAAPVKFGFKTDTYLLDAALTEMSGRALNQRFVLILEGDGVITGDVTIQDVIRKHRPFISSHFVGLGVCFSHWAPEEVRDSLVNSLRDIVCEHDGGIPFQMFVLETSLDENARNIAKCQNQAVPQDPLLDSTVAAVNAFIARCSVPKLETPENYTIFCDTLAWPSTASWNEISAELMRLGSVQHVVESMQQIFTQMIEVARTMPQALVSNAAYATVLGVAKRLSVNKVKTHPLVIGAVRLVSDLSDVHRTASPADKLLTRALMDGATMDPVEVTRKTTAAYKRATHAVQVDVMGDLDAEKAQRMCRSLDVPGLLQAVALLTNNAEEVDLFNLGDGEEEDQGLIPVFDTPQPSDTQDLRKAARDCLSMLFSIVNVSLAGNALCIVLAGLCLQTSGECDAGDMLISLAQYAISTQEGRFCYLLAIMGFKEKGDRDAVARNDHRAMVQVLDPWVLDIDASALLLRLLFTDAGAKSLSPAHRHGITSLLLKRLRLFTVQNAVLDTRLLSVEHQFQVLPAADAPGQFQLQRLLHGTGGMYREGWNSDQDFADAVNSLRVPGCDYRLKAPPMLARHQRGLLPSAVKLFLLADTRDIATHSLGVPRWALDLMHIHPSTPPEHCLTLWLQFVTLPNLWQSTKWKHASSSTPRAMDTYLTTVLARWAAVTVDMDEASKRSYMIYTKQTEQCTRQRFLNPEGDGEAAPVASYENFTVVFTLRDALEDRLMQRILGRSATRLALAGKALSMDETRVCLAEEQGGEEEEEEEEEKKDGETMVEDTEPLTVQFTNTRLFSQFESVRFERDAVFAAMVLVLDCILQRKSDSCLRACPVCMMPGAQAHMFRPDCGHHLHHECLRGMQDCIELKRGDFVTLAAARPRCPLCREVLPCAEPTTAIDHAVAAFLDRDNMDDDAVPVNMKRFDRLCNRQDCCTIFSTEVPAGGPCGAGAESVPAYCPDHRDAAPEILFGPFQCCGAFAEHGDAVSRACFHLTCADPECVRTRPPTALSHLCAHCQQCFSSSGACYTHMFTVRDYYARTRPEGPPEGSGHNRWSIYCLPITNLAPSPITAREQHAGPLATEYEGLGFFES